MKSLLTHLIMKLVSVMDDDPQVMYIIEMKGFIYGSDRQ